jgi:hypothetical protein
VPLWTAVEWQWTLGEIINAVISAGLDMLHVAARPAARLRAHVQTAASSTQSR